MPPPLNLALLVCGPSCAGKTTLGQLAVARGWRWVEQSDSLQALGIDRSMALEPQLRELFSSRGEDAIAHVTTKRVQEAAEGVTPLVITGVRNEAEFRYYSAAFPSTSLAVYASTAERHRRVLLRARSSPSPTFEDFVRAMAWEYALGLGRIMGASKHLVVNDGSLDAYHREVLQTLDAIWPGPG